MSIPVTRAISEPLEDRRFLSAAISHAIEDAPDTQPPSSTVALTASSRDAERADDAPTGEKAVANGDEVGDGERRSQNEKKAVDPPDKPDATVQGMPVISAGAAPPSRTNSGRRVGSLFASGDWPHAGISQSDDVAGVVMASPRSSVPAAMPENRSRPIQAMTQVRVDSANGASIAEISFGRLCDLTRAMSGLIEHSVQPSTCATLGISLLHDLGSPNAMTQFADAIADFAHESAALGTSALVAANGHARAWTVTVGLMVFDAIWIAYWYEIIPDRRNPPPKIKRSVRLGQGLRSPTDDSSFGSIV